jgi:hypothetical protein
MLRHKLLYRENAMVARTVWPGKVNAPRLRVLRRLTSSYGFSIASGDLVLLENGWYVTHTGLLRLARRRRCAGIQVEPAPALSDPSAARWVFKASVFNSPRWGYLLDSGSPNT